MNSKIFFAFLLALFFLALFVLTGYASNIFAVSKQATYANTKNIDCSNFDLNINTKLSVYNPDTDDLRLVIYNNGFDKISELTIFLNNQKFIFKSDLDPGTYGTIVLQNISRFNPKSVEICPNNCSSSCYHLDLDRIKNYR